MKPLKPLLSAHRPSPTEISSAYNSEKGNNIFSHESWHLTKPHVFLYYLPCLMLCKEEKGRTEARALICFHNPNLHIGMDWSRVSANIITLDWLNETSLSKYISPSYRIKARIRLSSLLTRWVQTCHAITWFHLIMCLCDLEKKNLENESMALAYGSLQFR